MSLLLDALKRAEEAKKAQRDSNEASPTSTGDEPLSLAPLDEQGSSLSEGEVPPPLMTRDRLPNISQSMSILPEDFSVPLQREAKRAANGKQSKADQPVKHPAHSASLASAQSDRNTARQLFEAKAPNYDPRRPFYITLGALGVFAVGAIAYFWYQLQPPAFANRQATPPQNAVERTTEARVPSNTQSISNAALAATAAVSSTTATANDATVIPVEPQAPTRLTPAPRETLTAPTASAQRDTRNADHISLIKSKPQGPSAVEQGYAAFEGGDLVAARSHYQAALTQDPLSRDALLGLAAIDMREQQYTSAEARYVRLLEIDPRDPYAHAGLIGLRGRSDPVATESRIKNLLAQRPDANVLHFTLGNQYATQGRWPEAQQAYFKAYSTDPANPDYAFNLAVSLDQLRQSKLALEYYQKALALASARPATFLPSQAEARIRELNR